MQRKLRAATLSSEQNNIYTKYLVIINNAYFKRLLVLISKGFVFLLIQRFRDLLSQYEVSIL